MDEYIEPVTMDEARQMRHALWGEIRNLEAQLSAEKATIRGAENPKSPRMVAYREFRRRTLNALEQKHQIHTRLKEWMRVRSKADDWQAGGVDVHDPKQIMQFLSRRLVELHKDFNIPFSDEENAVMHAARDFIVSRIVVKAEE